MAIVNSKLGNGFRIKSIDSPLDNLHYFGGSGKHIEFMLLGLSGSTATGLDGLNRDNNSQFDLAAGDNVDLTGVLYDVNGTRINTGSFVPGLLGYSPDEIRERFDPFLVLEVSSSDSTVFQLLDLSNFGVFYRNANGDAFTYANGNGGLSVFEILPEGREPAFPARTAPKDISNFLRVGWNLSEFGDVSFPLLNNTTHFQIAATGSDFVVRNVRLEFKEKLSSGGVDELRNIENQHTDKITPFINRNIMPGVDD